MVWIVRLFFVPFKGDYRGRKFDSLVPPQMCFQNAPNCEGHRDFVEEAIMKGLKNGFDALCGKNG